MDTLLIAVIAASNIICFLIGAKVGQKVSKGEDIKLPNMNPVEAYKKREARKEAEVELDRISTIMQNIESYDGTSYGQKDVPR